MPKIVLAGCAPDTGNLGVSALGYSVLAGLIQRLGAANIELLDHGRGLRHFEADGFSSQTPVVLRGAIYSRRLNRPESLIGARICQRLGVSAHPLLRALSHTHLLDISGGDSFTDLYGQKRFESIAVIKELALETGGRLTLLPQTYGPFNDANNRQRAAAIVGRAAQAWARDARSFDVLRDLLGNRFEPSRHRLGVDVAFALPVVEPERLEPSLRVAIKNDSPLYALNISGLIYNDPYSMRERYGFRADYREVVHRLVEKLLSETQATVMLVPHVDAVEGNPESDPAACRAVVEWVKQHIPAAADRLLLAPMFTDPRHAKWLISQADWFCGTRMHSTIADLMLVFQRSRSTVLTKGKRYSEVAVKASSAPRTRDTAHLRKVPMIFFPPCIDKRQPGSIDDFRKYAICPMSTPNGLVV